MKRHCKSWDLLEGKMCFIVPHRDPVWYDFSVCVSFVQIYNRKFGGKYEPHLCLHIWKKPELKKSENVFHPLLWQRRRRALFQSSLRSKWKIHIWHLGLYAERNMHALTNCISSMATKITKNAKLHVFACVGVIFQEVSCFSLSRDALEFSIVKEMFWTHKAKT